MAQALYQTPYQPPAPLPLTTRQRDLLRLRYDAAGRTCRTHPEVAQLLGCSAGRIRNLESKARHRLRVLQRVVWAEQPLGREQMADWQQFRAVIEQP